MTSVIISVQVGIRVPRCGAPAVWIVVPGKVVVIVRVMIRSCPLIWAHIGFITAIVALVEATEITVFRPSKEVQTRSTL